MSEPQIDKMKMGEIKKALKNGRISSTELHEYVRSLVSQLDFPKIRLAGTFSRNFRSEMRSFQGEIGKSIVAMSKAFAEKIGSLHGGLTELIRESVIKLAGLGWFVSYKIGSVAPDEMIRLVNSGKTEEVDRILVKYFRSHLRSIMNSIFQSFPKRRHILAEAFWSHRKKRYSVSIPIFYIQADGICVDLSGVQLFKKVGKKKNRRPVTADRLDKFMDQPYGDAFVEPLRVVLPLTQDMQLLDAKDYNINRHAIIHGHSLDYGIEINSLKAISLVYFLSALSEKKDRKRITQDKYKSQ